MLDLGFIKFWKIMILNMVGSLDVNGMMISEIGLVIKRVKHWVNLRQLWRAVKIRRDKIVGNELDHEI
jgi:hypothetical protein